MIYGDHISEEDLSLYAMRSMAPNENAATQRHLDSCAECRGRLADAVGGLTLIALSVPQEPLPAGARDRFLKRIKAETFEPPVAAARVTAMPEPRTGPSGSWFGGLGWLAATAAIAFAVYLGNREHDLQQQLAAQRYQNVQLSGQISRAQQIMDVLTSHSAQRVTLTEAKVAAQPTAHVIYVKEHGALIFVASNLHPVSANKTYELWLIPANGQAPIPSGLFRPDASGSASVVLPPLPEGVDAKAFGVTVEEAQGATTPTMPIVMSGQ